MIKKNTQIYATTLYDLNNRANFIRIYILVFINMRLYSFPLVVIGMQLIYDFNLHNMIDT